MNKFKKVFLLVVAIIIVFTLPLNVFAMNNDEINTKKVDEYIENIMKKDKIPGVAIGIIKGDEIIYAKGYGEARNGVDVTLETPFEIGSVTKSFTSLGIMQLSEREFLNLDDSVEKYLPWFNAYYNKEEAKITIRELLNQTSGIPNFHDNDVSEDTTIDTVVKENLNNLNLLNKPGSEFYYSNGNYIILGEIIEVLSKKSYEEYMEENVFKPLEMNNTYLSKDKALENGLADGYTTYFGLVAKRDTPYFIANAPAGYIISSGKDMCNYLSIFLNEGRYKGKSIVSKEGIEELMKPAIKTGTPIGSDATETKYAMGWFVNYKDGKIDRLQHTGEHCNYHSSVAIDPNEDIAVVELDNLGGYVSTGPIADGVLKISLNEEPIEGINIQTILIIYNIVYIVIALLIIVSIVRLKTFKKRVSVSKKRYIFNVIFTIIINILLPLAIILGTPSLMGATWRASIFYSPDICFFLIGIAIVLFAIGIRKSVYLLKLKRDLNRNK